MRWNTHPGRALIVGLLVMLLMPGMAVAQDASPGATPPSPEQQQAVWETLEGVDRAVMRTWGDIPEGTPDQGEVPTLRFVTGLVAQFDGPTHAAAAVEHVEQLLGQHRYVRHGHLPDKVGCHTRHDRLASAPVPRT